MVMTEANGIIVVSRKTFILMQKPKTEMKTKTGKDQCSITLYKHYAHLDCMCIHFIDILSIKPVINFGRISSHYARDAMRARYLLSPCVRPSDCLPSVCHTPVLCQNG